MVTNATSDTQVSTRVSTTSNTVLSTSEVTDFLWAWSTRSTGYLLNLIGHSVLPSPTTAIKKQQQST